LKYDTARPFAASYVLIERDGKYLFVKRANTDWMNGFYGLPAGKVEKNEGYLTAAVREANEEVGVTVRPEHMQFALAYWRHEDDEPDMEWCDMVFRVAEFTGEPINAEPQVHDEIAWFALDDLPENTIPSLRLMLDAINRGEMYGEHNYFIEK
jgi:ADP-ribose pyrophosphatase YjhB (NUDIX family)